jgi:predicted short-subunit dehydrogenase-like oxidoreductase (DUF2520 family)
VKLGFIGAGRVARGLGVALREAGYAVPAVASRTPGSARNLSALLHGQAVTAQAVADTCDLVFLTVPDDTIERTARALHWRAGQGVVHCSGATEVSALDSAREAGAQTGGFHPLQSFADGGTPVAGCTVTVEAEPPLAGTLQTMVTALRCRLNRLPPGKRAIYHASAGYGSQFLNVLMAEIVTLWGDWGASEADVLAAILPMARTSLDAIEQGGVAPSMPGPVSRGDIGSITAHCEALAAMPDALAFYRAHALRSVDLAERAGRIEAETARTLRARLDPA